MTATADERAECPICGGRIQATREEYLDKLVLSADCQDVMSDGSWTGAGDTRIYCENDCTQAEMIEAARVTAEEN